MKVMNATSAVVAIGGAVFGAAIGLAGPASADPPSGDNTGTMIDAETSDLQQGGTAPFTLNPCGPDCIHVVQTGSGWELHRQGASWVGARSDGGPVTLDEATLVLHVDSASGQHLVIGLVKNG